MHRLQHRLSRRESQEVTKNVVVQYPQIKRTSIHFNMQRMFIAPYVRRRRRVEKCPSRAVTATGRPLILLLLGPGRCTPFLPGAAPLWRDGCCKFAPGLQMQINRYVILNCLSNTSII